MSIIDGLLRTGSWHLGEDRFRIMQRPFTTAQEMVDEFVERHNAIVKPDDRVFMVGDAVNQNTPEFLEQVSRFNGEKTLFRGNHDRVFTDEQLGCYFDTIVAEGSSLVLTLKEEPLKVNIQHYPTEATKEYFNLVGHIHKAWQVQLNALNVGVDVHNFAPLNLDEDIPFFYNAICNFYDDDVWVAYWDTQKSYSGKRGKPGRYLDFDGQVGGGH